MKTIKKKTKIPNILYKTRMPNDLHIALNGAPKAIELWDKITPITRSNWILWINTAKKPKTRKSRIIKAIGMLTSGKRNVCCFGGINWLIKNQVK